MLVLNLKVGRQLMIGDNILVKVVGIRGKQVRLGLVAPREVPIAREEVCPLIHPTTASSAVVEPPGDAATHQ